MNSHERDGYNKKKQVCFMSSLQIREDDYFTVLYLAMNRVEPLKPAAVSLRTGNSSGFIQMKGG